MYVAILQGICYTNTDKMATNVIAFTFTANGMRIYLITLPKIGQHVALNLGNFRH